LYLTQVHWNGVGWGHILHWLLKKKGMRKKIDITFKVRTNPTRKIFVG